MEKAKFAPNNAPAWVDGSAFDPGMVEMPLNQPVVGKQQVEQPLKVCCPPAGPDVLVYENPKMPIR